MLGLVGGMLSFSTAKVSQVAMNGTNSNKIAMEAQSIAQSDADLLRATNYTDLSASARKVATNTNFQHEVILSNEKDYTNTIKERTATINVYKGQETIPRATMHVTRYSTEKEFSGVPVGTVIAWPGAKAPTTNGVWLECNGQSCASYPALVAVLGKNTVPDYRNRFLESSTTAGTVKEAGLPNIAGKMGSDSGTYEESRTSSNIEPITAADTRGNFTGSFFLGPLQNYASGCQFYPRDGLSDYVKNYGVNTAPTYIGFDASRFNKIYGNSNTVQPPSITVRRFIKAS